MDLPNLATVICPNILYPKGRDVAREESFMAIRVVTILLERQDDFFTVPDEFLSILHDQDYFTSCMDMPPKDVLRKCETYLRLKQGRLNGAERGYNGTNGHPHGGDDGGIHQKRSDPMMRGRPTPPFAGDQNGEKARRSPRSASRGPPSSHSHPAHGNASSPNLHEPKPYPLLHRLGQIGRNQGQGHRLGLRLIRLEEAWTYPVVQDLTIAIVLIPRRTTNDYTC